MKSQLFLSCVAVGALVILSGCDTNSGGYNISLSPSEPVAGETTPQPVESNSSQGINDTSTSPQIKTNYEAKTWPPTSRDKNLRIVENVLAENYYIVLDGSGSMAKAVTNSRQRRMDAAKEAVRKFVNSLPDDVNLGLLSFQPARELVAIGPKNKSDVIQYVNRLTPSGKTPLNRAIKTGYEALVKQAQKQSGYGTYKLVVVTDGRSTDQDPASLARKIVEDSPIEVHVIGFAVDNHSLKIPGVTQFVTANSTEDLIKALSEVTKSESEAFDSTSFQ